MRVGSEKVRCDMSIDIDEMVRMAGERAGWVYSDGMIYEPYIGSKEEERNHTIAVIKHVSEGEFIARAPKTIAYLAARVRVLEAQNAALQARVNALEAQSEHLKLLFDCVIGKAPLPPIKGYSVAWHYSEDCYLYDSDLAEMQGHICYSWEGEDDAPQVASYESIAFFVVYGDDDDETLAESVKAWKVKARPLPDDPTAAV